MAFGRIANFTSEWLIRCDADRSLFGQLLYAFGWRHLAVEPILLVSQGSPCRLHTLVPLERRVVLRSFCELSAVLRVLSKMIRWFHELSPYRGHRKLRGHSQHQMDDTFAIQMNVRSVCTAATCLAAELLTLHSSSFMEVRSWGRAALSDWGFDGCY